MSTRELGSPRPNVLLVGSFAVDEQGLLDALAGWRDPVVERVSDSDRIGELMGQRDWDVALYDHDPARPDAEQQLQAAIAALGRVPLVVCAGPIGESAAAGVIRAGARDFARRLDHADILAALDRCLTVAATLGPQAERDAAAQAVRAAQDTFTRAFADAPAGMAVVSTRGELVRVNQALCDLIGYRAEDLMGRRFQEWLHPEDADLDAAEVRRLLLGQAERYTVQKRYFHRRGPLRWLNISVSMVRKRDGTPLHFLAQVIDITEAKEAEAALREANARLKAILENVPAWISLRGLDGRYIDANQQLADIYGTTKEELIGRYPADFAQTKATADLVDDDRLVWESGKPVEREIDVAHPDGQRRTYHTVRYPVFDEHGEIGAIGSFAMDISDRKRADASRDRALADLQEAQQIAQVGSWRWDAVSDRSEWSPQLKRIFGRDPDGASPQTGEEFFAYVVREDRRRVAEAFRQLLAGGSLTRQEFRIEAEDGVQRTVQMLGYADSEHPGSFTGTLQDLTSMRAAERDIALVQERFRRAFEHAPVGMAISEPEGRTLQVNDALCAMLGYTREQLLLLNSSELIHPEDLAERAELLRQLLDGEISGYEREDRMFCANGESIWVSRHITALRAEHGQPLQILTHIVDIGERRRMERELRHMADHDPLTGLLNRRGLEVELERHVAHVNRYGARGALLVLDLDHFKVVNDTLGHEAGDRLIVSVADLLRNRLRDSDAVARLGGDEFAVLLPDATSEVAEYVAGEIVRDIQENAAVADGPVRRHVSASIGVTVFTQGLVNAEEALVNADLAMYDAKEAGRGRVAMHVAERNDSPHMKTRLSWMDRIRAALDEDRLTVYGQPIMALHSGAVNQYELLLRMLDESGDTIPPGAFLYVAERYDLIQEIDEWVFKEAVRLLETQGTTIEDSLEINVSGKSLGSERFLAMIESELHRSHIEPARLVFEVTETAAIANITLARHFAERLKQIGCRFALDDFGAGFGSFFYLKHIPFDYLKIDREFITNCLSSRTDQLVIESLVQIARGLNKQTIAEGVEDQETELFLRHNGVDYAQGFHIGRPVPVSKGIPRWDTAERRMR